MTDALNGVTTLTYDAGNQPLTRTDALGQITRYSYAAAGNLLSESDPLGQVTRYTYDTAGQRLRGDPVQNLLNLQRVGVSGIK